MKNWIMYLIAALATIAMSCAGQKNENAETEAPAPEQEQSAEQECTYSMAQDGFELLWVAYKYTEKTGVNGSFDDYTLSGIASGSAPEDVVKGASIEVVTASVNSGDPERDPKIVASFFGTLSEGENLSAKVVSMADGSITMDLTMNGQTNAVTGTYETENDVLEAKFEINVADWGGSEGIKELNRVCEDLHKGADGSSVLWPDVTLFATAKLDKDCS